MGNPPMQKRCEVPAISMRIIRRSEGQVLDRLLPHFPGHQEQSLHHDNGGMKWHKLKHFLRQSHLDRSL